MDNARAATGARIVMLTHFDKEMLGVTFITWSGFQSPIIRAAIEAARKIMSNFDPLRITTRADLNEHNKSIYFDGKSVASTAKELAKWIVDERIMQLADTMAGIRYAYA